MLIRCNRNSNPPMKLWSVENWKNPIPVLAYFRSEFPLEKLARLSLSELLPTIMCQDSFGKCKSGQIFVYSHTSILLRSSLDTGKTAAKSVLRFRWKFMRKLYHCTLHWSFAFTFPAEFSANVVASAAMWALSTPDKSATANGKVTELICCS